VTISDLRANVGLLQQSAGHDPSKSKKNTRGHTSKEGSNFEDQDSDVERTESLDTPIADQGGDAIENDDSDQDSEAKFKRRGHKKVGPSLPILLECLVEIVFSMTSQVVQTCLSLKM